MRLSHTESTYTRGEYMATSEGWRYLLLLHWTRSTLTNSAPNMRSQAETTAVAMLGTVRKRIEPDYGNCRQMPSAIQRRKTRRTGRSSPLSASSSPLQPSSSTYGISCRYRAIDTPHLLFILRIGSLICGRVCSGRDTVCNAPCPLQKISATVHFPEIMLRRRRCSVLRAHITGLIFDTEWLLPPPSYTSEDSISADLSPPYTKSS